MKKIVFIAAVAALAVLFVSANVLSIAGVLIPEAAKAVDRFDSDPIQRVQSVSEPSRIPAETATVDGTIVQLKLSPSGRHVHGFYLDDGAEVNLPPSAHETNIGQVGERIEATGVISVSMTGQSLMHATSVTNVDTGETLDMENLAPPGPLG